MKQVLLAVQLETQFNELIRVARLLRDTKSYSVLFCFYDLTPLRFSRMKTLCLEEKFDFILLDQDEDKLLEQNDLVAQESSARGNVSTKRMRSLLRRAFPSLELLSYFWDQFRGFTRYLVVGIRQIIRARGLLLKQKPSLLIVGEDGLGGPSSLIAVAISYNLPVVVVPYEYSTMTQPAEGIISITNYQHYYGISTFANRIIAKIFPQWVHEYLGERLLRETISFILAQELLGISPYLPWVVHGGRANYIAVENRAMFQHYLNQGVPIKKLVITGALYDDVLYKYAHQSESLIWSRLNSGDLPPKFKIVCSVPPDHVVSRPTCDFQTYWELLDFWIENLKRLEDVAVIFQLHPRVTDEQAKYIASKDVAVVKDDIALLIPQCDVLVTSVSSIIRLAIASKKIVVNYDVYKFTYQDYDNVGGVITFQEKSLFPVILHKLVTDKSFFDEMMGVQSKNTENWGYLDGNAGKRMLSFFDEITS